MGGTADASGAWRVDPLAPSHPGRWADGPVVVCHLDRAAVPVRLVAARPPERVTPHFEVHRTGERLLVLHRLRPDELDDDIAGLLATELSGPGLLESATDFERVFTGIVRSTLSDPLTAWSTFYANSLATLRGPVRSAGPGPTPGSSLAAFAPVHDRARAEIAGRTVLDVGSCFGFLPLRLAGDGFDVVACDHTAGTMALLAAVARHRREAVRTVVADARALPFAASSVDTVTGIHLLEHLPASDTRAVLDEMLRVARRVVVAVPYEDVPEPVHGHLRTVDHADLDALGAGSGHRWRVEDHHGGWLVIDR